MEGNGSGTPLAGRASAVGVYDPSNARDALRFVSEMLQAGTAEEVVQQVLLSDQREQWSAVLCSLVDGDEEKGWSRAWSRLEMRRLREQLSATTAAMEEAAWVRNPNLWHKTLADIFSEVREWDAELRQHGCRGLADAATRMAREVLGRRS